MTDAATRDTAKQAGREARRSGLLMVAPDYDRESLCAAWRVGWLQEDARLTVSRGQEIGDDADQAGDR